jgi:hypothetical protein
VREEKMAHWTREAVKLPNNDGLNAPAVRVMRQEKTTPFP